MCTVIKFLDKDGNFYFGRNLDLDQRNYGEQPLLAPKGYEITYKHLPSETLTTPVIGMGINLNGYPLFFEAASEKGLAIANLNFPNNAYFPEDIVDDKENVTPYELTLWVLNHCSTVEEVKELLLNKSHIIGTPVAEHMPISPVHWIVSDNSKSSIVIETTKDKGLQIFDNPINVLTNNPTFEWHLQNLNYYVNLNPHDTDDSVWDEKTLKPQGVGTGSLGLPGDATPQSRFIRASYLNANYPTADNETENVARAFNTLGSIAMPRGTVINREGDLEYTLYSCCYSQKTKTFYYRKWNDANIKEISISDQNREGDKLIAFEN